jgi:hypothetical protein
MDYLVDRNSKDLTFISFTRYISATVTSLRKQLSHIEPSLRYVRENKEKILLSEYFKEVENYYKSRFEAHNMELQINYDMKGEFDIFINKGKLNQIIDNLLLNSEYWLREDLRLKRLARRHRRVFVLLKIFLHPKKAILFCVDFSAIHLLLNKSIACWKTIENLMRQIAEINSFSYPSNSFTTIP